ncbi:MAG: PSP1 C-terminal domain-containing protein [Planctomycetota bacterium]
MPACYLVRTGLFDELSWFQIAPGIRVPENGEVICRTARGLEVGVALAAGDDSPHAEAVGEILRPVNDQDRLIIERLERFKLRAIESCERLLAERQIAATLVDAEHLFDGQHLFFYFWGNASAELDAVLDELAASYDHRVGFSRFAARLAEGCGPGCGTKNSACGSEQAGGCSNCGSGGCGLKPGSRRSVANP